MPIFDQGYQHWSGHLSGHAWRWLAITRHGVKSGMKNRWIRIFLLVAWLPAIPMVVALCLWGLLERNSDFIAPVVEFLRMSRIIDPAILDTPRQYRLEIWTLCYHFFLQAELRLSMFLIVLVGPDLISQDLRFNALPLYFSRPLRRIDYFLGKLGVIAAYLGLVMIVPTLIAYGLGLLFSLDITIVRDTWRLFFACITYGVVIVLSAGLLILALSSLSRNSRYVALFWLGIWIISGIVATILQTADHAQRQRAFYTNLPGRQAQQGGQTREERMKQQQEWTAAYQKKMENFAAEEALAAKSNWRPLVSYTANLSRVGQYLLGSDACWKKISELQPENQRARFLLNVLGPQYPWYWSAVVLAVIFGLSAWILNFPFRSLDRLR